MKHVILCLLLSLFLVSAQDSTAITGEKTEKSLDSTITNVKKEGVFISGTPDSISVKINGVERGVTPLTISDLPQGEHTVVLTKKGFYGKKINVTTFKDSLIEVNAELRAPGSVTITSNPEGALIFMDKKKIDKTPFTVSPVRPGSYSIMLLRGGYAQYDTTIEVTSGADDTLSVEMVSSKPVTPVTEAETVVDSSSFANSEKNNEPVAGESIDEKKRKKIFKVIGSAIIATFLTVILISELSSGDEN